MACGHRRSVIWINYVIREHFRVVFPGMGNGVQKNQNPHPFDFAQGRLCRIKRDKGGAPGAPLAFRRSTLSGGLHDQDHAWADYSHVAVIAFQGGDGGAVGVGDGVESFAVLHFVVHDCSGSFAVDLG